MAGKTMPNAGHVGALKLAFDAGYTVGTAIDKATGLSDKISDKLLDWFGPWPWR